MRKMSKEKRSKKILALMLSVSLGVAVLISGSLQDEKYFIANAETGVPAGTMEDIHHGMPDAAIDDSLQPTDGVNERSDTYGNKYTGNYEDGIKTGRGTLIFNNGDKYVGDFENNLRNGNGTYTWANGSQFNGTFEDDEPVSGTYNTSSKSMEGEFIDLRLYDGTIEFSNDKYDFYQDINEGKGGEAELDMANGTSYIGKIKSSKFNGKCYIYYSDDDEYNGNLKNNKKSGTGKYTWSDGSYYKGKWKNDKMNGKGKYYFAKTKATMTGTFKNNKPNGTFKYKKGKKVLKITFKMGKVKKIKRG